MTLARNIEPINQCFTDQHRIDIESLIFLAQSCQKGVTSPEKISYADVNR